MLGQYRWALVVDEVVQGFIKRDSISLKSYKTPDCAFLKDDYNSLYIFFMHIFQI